jgi:tetratricopeptide (TPR) repeat protein
MINAAVAAVVLCGASAAAFAQAIDDESRRAIIYDRCLAKAQTDPEAAYLDGLTWHETGGGLPARHCVAVALVGMRQYEEAASRLEILADEAPANDPSLRLGLIAQAAQAWLLSGRAERAEQLQARLIDAFPDDRQSRIDRAVTRLTLGRLWDAVDDLNVAVELNPRDPEALLYRASAYRYLDAVDLARDDVHRVLAIDASLPEAWLENGILDQIAGDRDAARRSWLEVLRLEPEGPAAAAARARLEAMDAGRR